MIINDPTFVRNAVAQMFQSGGYAPSGPEFESYVNRFSTLQNADQKVDALMALNREKPGVDTGIYTRLEAPILTQRIGEQVAAANAAGQAAARQGASQQEALAIAQQELARQQQAAQNAQIATPPPPTTPVSPLPAPSPQDAQSAVDAAIAAKELAISQGLSPAEIRAAVDASLAQTNSQRQAQQPAQEAAQQPAQEAAQQPVQQQPAQQQKTVVSDNRVVAANGTRGSFVTYSDGTGEIVFDNGARQSATASALQASYGFIPEAQYNQPQPQTAFLTGAAPTSLSPESLPELRGAASGESRIDPTLRPYLELGLQGAEKLFLQQQPSLFPGQMFVGPSEQTQAALNMQESLARAQPTPLQAAEESFMRGLGGIGATAGGAFLMGSPYRQQVIESATRPLAQQFEQTILPGVASFYSRAGRYGSGAMERAVGTATEATGRAIGDVASNIAFQDYSAERQRQQQALGLQIEGATRAPQIYAQQFLPAQQLAQVGAAREAIAAQPLQEQMARFQFGQQVPYQQLQGFLSSVYGTPLGSSQIPGTPQAQTNQFGQALGGALLGSQLGNMFGGFGGLSGSQTGAILGGLGGLLL